MSHIKGVLASGSYHVTLRSVQHTDDAIQLVWTIDQDTEYAWRNIIETFDDSEYGLARIERICKALNRQLPDDLESLIGIRALLDIMVQLKGNLRRNVVLEHNLPKEPAHFDVTKERTDAHFYHNEQKPTLPI